jgi:hypothetical protein
MTRGANLHSAQNARRVSNAGEPGVSFQRNIALQFR